MSKWMPNTFEKNAKRSTYCTGCLGYLGFDSRLSDDKPVRKECKKCGMSNIIHPPRKAIIEDKKVILFRDAQVGKDPMQCTFTSDNTP